MKPLMKCGHTANGIDSNGNQVCCICVGIKPEARIVEDELPNLEGRIAECCYCSNKDKSDFNLAFIEYRPHLPKDKFYCGCYGWD